MPPNEVAAPFQRPDSAETKTIDKAAVCWNLFSRSIASVAQLAEQLTLNQLVEGSSPSRGTTLNPSRPLAFYARSLGKNGTIYAYRAQLFRENLPNPRES